MVKNSLQETHPGLAREWHPAKNDGLEPSQITAGSNRVIWWFLPYDDPRTKKHFDFEWQASVKSRTKQKCGCPFLTNKRLWKGYNDLETLHPDLAREWNVENSINHRVSGEGNPYLAGKSLCAGFNDLDKTFRLEWETSVNARTSKDTGCPYLMNKAVWKEYNDLQTRYPEIAREGLKNLLMFILWNKYLPFCIPAKKKNPLFLWPCCLQ